MSTLLGILLAAVPALAGFASSGPLDPNDITRWDLNPMPLDWSNALYERTYRAEGGEIVPWTAEAVLPSPDNAALLYYQAFLLRPEPDDVTSRRIADVLRGGLPDTSIRLYLGKCREMIHTMEVASRVPQCTWGIRRLDPDSFSEKSLIGQLRQAVFILAVDARTLAVDGRYDAAFARCLTTRRLARHVGDETMAMPAISQSIDGLSQRAMQYVLGVMPPDADALRMLRGQLASVPGAALPIEKTMQSTVELSITSLRDSPLLIDLLKWQIARNAPDESTRQMAQSLTDDEIIARVKESYRQFLNRIFRIMDSDMPYEQKYAEIQSQTQGFIVEYGGDPARWNILSASTIDVVFEYNASVRHAADYNALKAAIEVYLAYAETGQLPETLPAYSPKDPFSGQDFEYEVTATGFLLRCRAKDLYAGKVQEYDFTVRHEDTQNLRAGGRR